MATLNIHDGVLSVRFSPAEKILGLVRDLDLALSAVSGATAVPDGLAAVHGLRSPGLGLPGARKIGTWRGRHEKTLVSVRRGQPAVRLRVDGARYDSLVIGLDDAAAWVDRIQAARS